jgi:hypothetical protein
MKRIIGILIIVLSVIVIILNACTREAIAGAIALPSDIASRLKAEVRMPKGVIVSDENAEETGQLVIALMGKDFDSAMFDGYAVYPPVVNVTASEFGIFKVKDLSDIDKAEEIARRRIEKIQALFSDERNEQYKIAENGEVRTDGKYVYYSMSKDNGKVFDIISDMLNDK